MEQIEEDSVVRLPPHSDDLERAVLACVMTEPSKVLSSFNAQFKCGEDVFFDERHKAIFRCIRDMYKRGDSIDLITLDDFVNRSCGYEAVGGKQYFNSIPMCATSAVMFPEYARQLAGVFMDRELFYACTNSAQKVYEKHDAEMVISEFEAKLRAIREIRATDTIVKGPKAAELLTEHLEQRKALQGRKSGVVTGLTRLDDLTDGLQYGEQTIVGARPSQGKTALATTIIHRACLIDKIPTLVITLEMSIEALCRRILSAHCRFPMGRLRSGDFGDYEIPKFAGFHALIHKSPIHFYDAISGSDVGRICETIRRLARTDGLKLVITDYLQKVRPMARHEKRTYEVAEVSGALKAVAVETGVAMLTLAQLNRESEKEKGRPPRLSDLADSGQIERDGDCIILLERHREEGRGNEAKLIVAKQRDGETGIVQLNFDGKFCLFEDAKP